MAEAHESEPCSSNIYLSFIKVLRTCENYFFIRVTIMLPPSSQTFWGAGRSVNLFLCSVLSFK